MDGWVGVDGTIFPAWVDAGSFGGLTCAVVAAAALAVWALVRRRGTTRQSAQAILICLACAALMIFPVWWDQSRFQFFGSSLDSAEVTLVLSWVAVFGWTLPLGMLTSYMLLAEPAAPIERAPSRRSPQLEATLRLALADPARFVSVRPDDTPWAQLTLVNDDESAAGARPLMLRKRLTLIGREVDNDIVVNDERVSRTHAEVRVDHGVVVLLDYGSMNGTLINRQPVTSPVPLKPGDIVEFGMRRYRFALFEGPTVVEEVDTSKMPGANGMNRRQTLPPAGPPALVVVNGEAVGSRWELLAPVINIGRDGTCQIRLPDTTVSRRHAQIVRQADGYYASDLESNNGTLVNEDELKTPRRLSNGDLLRVGSVELRFVSIFPHSGAPLATEDEEAPVDGGVSPGQTTIPLTRDVMFPPLDENQPKQFENG